MKTFRAKRGPFREQPYFTDQEIKSICVDELQRQGLLPSEPAAIRIERFVEKRFNIVVEPAPLPQGVLGVTRFGSGGVQAMYVAESLDADKTTSAVRRVRSTIAHEAGHALLHAHLFAVPSTTPLFGDATDPIAPKVLCRDGAIESANRGYSGEWWEFQANAGMSHLLLPKRLVHQAVQRFLIPVGGLGGMQIDPDRHFQAVQSITEIFDVNPAMARIRLESLYAASGDRQLSL